ncbi:MAG: hypothetical protein HC785_02860, partial [Calothrix sp. CSU_2_0]|nr:hypothetical protein [Calothrix sp. CSU_2_0]
MRARSQSTAIDPRQFRQRGGREIVRLRVRGLDAVARCRAARSAGFTRLRPVIADAVREVLESGATEEQIQHVLKRVEELGMQAHLSRGTYRTIVGVIGDERKLQENAIDGDSKTGWAIDVLAEARVRVRQLDLPG